MKGWSTYWFHVVAVHERAGACGWHRMSTEHNSAWIRATLQADSTVHTAASLLTLYSCARNPHALLPLTFPCWPCSYPADNLCKSGLDHCSSGVGGGRGWWWLILPAWIRPTTFFLVYFSFFFLNFIHSEDHLQLGLTAFHINQPFTVGISVIKMIFKGKFLSRIYSLITHLDHCGLRVWDFSCLFSPDASVCPSSGPKGGHHRPAAMTPCS